jgi:dienelactone hydrolase
VEVPVGAVLLDGDLTVPAGATGVVQEAGLATLLMDLLTQAEEAVDEATGHLRFDIGLLAHRLAGATEWLRAAPDTGALRIGYFGASTGAAAALVAAAALPEAVAAVVSRGGRPDLAGDALARVRAPALLIVGGDAAAVLGLNEAALNELRCAARLAVVPGATHLFEEPGALEQVARLARGWFVEHLGAGRR